MVLVPRVENFPELMVPTILFLKMILMVWMLEEDRGTPQDGALRFRGTPQPPTEARMCGEMRPPRKGVVATRQRKRKWKREMADALPEVGAADVRPGELTEVSRGIPTRMPCWR